MSDQESSRSSFSPAGKKPVARATGGVQCLRCKRELDTYVFTKLSIHPYGNQSGTVMLECPKCGHLEFLSQNSPLLQRLKANAAAVGDGD
jgi:DNA-directed RNA polymerase subunit RPC12/RpoP